MAAKQIVDNYVNTSIDFPQTAYIAPSTSDVLLEAITVVNNSLVNASYSLYLKTTTGLLQPIIKDKIVVWGENDLGIGAVNQVMPAGSSLQFDCSALDSIYFTVTGREL